MIPKILIFVSISIVGQRAPAATGTALPGSGFAPLGFGDVAQWSMGLLVVLLAIFVCAWLLRKLTGFTSPSAGMVRVLGGVSLGSREKAILLQVGGKQLLLGVAPGSIRTLYVLEDDDAAKLESHSHESARPVPFMRRLHSVLQGEKHEQS